MEIVIPWELISDSRRSILDYLYTHKTKSINAISDHIKISVPNAS